MRTWLEAHGFYFPHVETTCVCPPIPTRQFDFQAYDAKTGPDLGCTTGHGATKQEAAMDLLQQMYREKCEINRICYWLAVAWVQLKLILD